MLEILKQFVDAGKLGGWVRAGIAAGAGYLAGKGLLKDFLTPDMIDAAGVVLSGVLVAVWSQVTKVPMPAAPVAALAPVMPKPVAPPAPVKPAA